MNRILEFTPSQEEAVVARVLVLVHQAVDEHFPAAEKAHRQFTKTVFSDDGEHTAALALPEGESADGRATSAGVFSPDNEVTSPSNRPEPAAALTTDTVRNDALQKNAKTASIQPVDTRSSSKLQPAASEETGEGEGAAEGVDWVTRVTLGLLIAGLILLAYALFA